MTPAARALLASPLGLIIGLILGALGGGGSVLAVPVLVYAAGQDPKAAITTSLVVVGIASVAGIGPHWRAGRVRLGTALVFGLCGVGGSVAGTQLNRLADPDLLLLGFSGVLIVAAWRMRIGCPTCTRSGERLELGRPGSTPPVVDVATLAPPRIDFQAVVKVLVAGTVLGFMTGLFGVGGGFVIVPALVLVLGFSMPEAIGTSLLIVAINSAVGVMMRFAMGGIDWTVTLPFTVTAVVGVIMGGRVADRLDPKRSLHWFSVLLVVVAIYTGARAAGSLL